MDNELMEYKKEEFDLKSAKKTFNSVEMRMAITIIIGMGLSLLSGILIVSTGSDLATSSWKYVLMSFIPVYVFGLPIGIFLLTRVKRDTIINTQKIGFGNALAYYFISVFIGYAGAIIGALISGLLGESTYTTAITGLYENINPLNYLFMIAGAPILEELVFRKMLIDSLGKYGERNAILLSAILFGVYHGNIIQAILAFGIGLVFGYVYTRTRKVYITIIYHAIINGTSGLGGLLMSKSGFLDMANATTGAVSSGAMESLVAEKAPYILGFGALCIYLLLAIIAGLVLFIIKVRKCKFEKAPMQLPKGTAFKTTYLNVGFVLFVVIVVGIRIISALL